MRPDIGAMVRVRSARARRGVVVAVVARWNVDADGLERVVRDVLRRGRKYVGRGQPDAAREERGNRGGRQQLRTSDAPAGRPVGPNSVKNPSRDPRVEGRRPELLKATGHFESVRLAGVLVVAHMG